MESFIEVVKNINWPVLATGLLGAGISIPAYAHGRSFVYVYAVWVTHAILNIILSLIVPQDDSFWVCITLLGSHLAYAIACIAGWVINIVRKQLLLRRLAYGK